MNSQWLLASLQFNMIVYWYNNIQTWNDVILKIPLHHDLYSMNDNVNKSSAPQDRSTPQLLSSTVHAWVVTEWPLQRLHSILRTELQKMTEENPN